MTILQRNKTEIKEIFDSNGISKILNKYGLDLEKISNYSLSELKNTFGAGYLHVKDFLFALNKGNIEFNIDEVKQRLDFILSVFYENDIYANIGEHLRKRQKESVLKTLNFLFSNKNNTGYIHFPTSSGKTVMFADIIRNILDKSSNKKILITVPNKEALKRSKQEFFMLGIDISEYSGDEKDLSSNIVVGTIQSLMNSDEINKNSFDLIICDEAHERYLGTKTTSFINAFNCQKIGFTATPELRNKNVEELFKIKIDEYLIDEAILNKELPEIDSSINFEIDSKKISNLKQINGDYTKESLKNFDIREIFPDLISTFKKGRLNGQQISIFMPSVALSKELTDLLNINGINSGHIDGTTKNRDEIQNDFENEKIQVITSCDALTSSWDSDIIDGVIILRPTLSPAKFMQMIGRGLHGKKVLKNGDKVPKDKIFVCNLVNNLSDIKTRHLTTIGLEGIMDLNPHSFEDNKLEKKGTEKNYSKINLTDNKHISEILTFYNLDKFFTDEKIIEIFNNFSESFNLSFNDFFHYLETDIDFLLNKSGLINIEFYSNNKMGNLYSNKPRIFEMNFKNFTEIINIYRKHYFGKKNLNRVAIENKKLEKEKNKNKILKKYSNILDNKYNILGKMGIKIDYDKKIIDFNNLKNINKEKLSYYYYFIVDLSELSEFKKLKSYNSIKYESFWIKENGLIILLETFFDFYGFKILGSELKRLEKENNNKAVLYEIEYRKKEEKRKYLKMNNDEICDFLIGKEGLQLLEEEGFIFDCKNNILDLINIGRISGYLGRILKKVYKQFSNDIKDNIKKETGYLGYGSTSVLAYKIILKELFKNQGVKIINYEIDFDNELIKELSSKKLKEELYDIGIIFKQGIFYFSDFLVEFDNIGDKGLLCWSEEIFENLNLDNKARVTRKYGYYDDIKATINVFEYCLKLLLDEQLVEYKPFNKNMILEYVKYLDDKYPENFVEEINNDEELLINKKTKIQKEKIKKVLNYFLLGSEKDKLYEYGIIFKDNIFYLDKEIEAFYYFYIDGKYEDTYIRYLYHLINLETRKTIYKDLGYNGSGEVSSDIFKSVFKSFMEENNYEVKDFTDEMNIRRKKYFEKEEKKYVRRIKENSNEKIDQLFEVLFTEEGKNDLKRIGIVLNETNTSVEILPNVNNYISRRINGKSIQKYCRTIFENTSEERQKEITGKCGYIGKYKVNNEIVKILFEELFSMYNLSEYGNGKNITKIKDKWFNFFTSDRLVSIFDKNKVKLDLKNKVIDFSGTNYISFMVMGDHLCFMLCNLSNIGEYTDYTHKTYMSEKKTRDVLYALFKDYGFTIIK